MLAMRGEVGGGAESYANALPPDFPLFCLQLNLVELTCTNNGIK